MPENLNFTLRKVGIGLLSQGLRFELLAYHAECNMEKRLKCQTEEAVAGIQA